MKNLAHVSTVGPKIHRLADIPFIYSQPTRTPLVYRLRVMVWRVLHAACGRRRQGQAHPRVDALM
jgi:hypothetical protein